MVMLIIKKLLKFSHMQEQSPNQEEVLDPEE